MVETEPDSKYTQNCDVINDRQLNGIGGSKELELRDLPARIILTPGDLTIKKPGGDPEKSFNSKADFEEAIELTGYGRYVALIEINRLFIENNFENM